MTPEERAQALEVARAIGRWAAAAIRTGPGAERPWTKGASPSDWVTAVDVAVEAGVRERLAQAYPQHRVVGEEGGASGEAQAPLVWYVDPVDGTTNFAHGLGWASFSLALVEDGQPQVGVVEDPFRGRSFHAVLGGGAYLDERRLEVAAGDPAGQVVLLELAGHRRWPGFERLSRALEDNGVTARVMGSSALGLAETAAGSAVGVVLGEFHPWDVAAGALILTEARGVLADLAGRVSPLPERGLIGGSGAWVLRLHDWLRADRGR